MSAGRRARRPARARSSRRWRPRTSPRSCSSRSRARAGSSRRRRPSSRACARSATSTAIVLVADEVQTGFGRTGRMFAMEHFGVEPDLMTVAKSIAAGLPLSGVIGKAEIMDAPGDSAVGGTYVGNPVAQAAALAVLDVFEEEGLVERARRSATTIRARMLEWQERFPAIGDVRGLGAMLAVEYVEDRQTKRPAPADRVARRRGGGRARAAAAQGRHPLELQPRALPARDHGRRARGGTRRVGGVARGRSRVAAPAPCALHRCGGTDLPRARRALRSRKPRDRRPRRRTVRDRGALRERRHVLASSGRTTGCSTARSRSRSCTTTTRATRSTSSASDARRARSRNSRTRTSSR